MLTTTAAYRMIASDLDRSLGNTARQPQVARERDYYLAHIGEVKSIDEFLADSRLYGFAMKAFGLQDMTYAKAFMRKVLTEGIDAEGAFATKLADPRYREFAETFNFARYGETATVFDRTRQGTVDRYVRQTLEENAGQQNEGARLALYFERKASSITSAIGLLADAALLKVVQTALGMPVEMSLASLDVQAKMITDRLDIEDLSDPDKLASFLSRFTSLYELQNPSSAASVPSILIGQSPAAGIGSGLLAALQNLQVGGG